MSDRVGAAASGPERSGGKTSPVGAARGSESSARLKAVLRTQLSGVLRRPARLMLTGLAMLVASFVVYATVLAQQITERTVLGDLSGTPAAVDFVVRGGAAETDVLARISALPGVAEAVGRVGAGGDVGGEYLGLTADPGSGPMAVARVIRGRYPSGPREIAVSPRTADRLGLPVGSTLAMVTGVTDDGKPTAPVRLSVVGLVDVRDDFGATGYAPQATITALRGDTALDQIDLRLVPGASAASVRSALDGIVAAAPASGRGLDRPAVSTGAQVRTQEAELVAAEVDSLFAVVAMFVAIALVAAALVATSTFRIVFAQRMRQLALLRTVGVGRGSIARALAAEGALTGLVAGVVGVLGALAAGHLGPSVARAFGAAVDGPGVPVRAALGVVALSVLITVLAVVAPAVSAAKVAPLEALRASSTTTGRRDIGVPRWLSGVLLAIGAGLLAGYAIANLPGPEEKNYDPVPVLLGIVASGALAFFALVALGPVLVRPVLAILGWPLRRLGPLGRLAVGGVGGAPRRAAAVSVVVALGVTLIAGVIVGGASVRVLADRESAASAPADYELTASGAAKLTAAMVDQARASRELTRVTPYRRLGDVTAGTSNVELTAVDLDVSALPALDKLDVRSGSLAALGPGTMVLSRYASDATGLRTGDTAALTAGGRSVRLTVAALLPDTAPLGTGIVLDPADLTRLGAPAAYAGLLADAAQPGEAGRTAGRQALRQVTGGSAGLGVAVLADQRDQIDRSLDAVLAIAIGLVGLTVLIAVVGVGTTTALSVVERVRESGLLRAVGLSRRGLRGLLTAESALYGVVGAALGLVLGVPYAWLTIRALGESLPLLLPVGQLAVVFVVLVAFTALAGVLPARRAAKVSPVVALGVDA